MVVRGRVLDNPDPGGAVDGEGTWTAVRRTVERFLTNELPDVPLEVTLGTVTAPDHHRSGRLLRGEAPQPTRPGSKGPGRSAT